MKSSTLPSIVLGGTLSFLFYGAIHKGWISHPFILRYFATHPIEYVSTTMFFVGLALLIVRYLAILTQRQMLQRSPILAPNPQPLPLSQASSDISTILAHEKKYGVSLLTERLKTHLHFLRRSASASNLDAEIRNRAEDTATRSDADYGLVRLLLWAIPMTGFLGTVIGITAALDNLDLNAINESSKKLSAGLAIAFDTTGLAIGIAVVLFFIQFLVYREETNLLSETDRLTESELCGRYEQNDKKKESESVITIHRMLETITATIEQTAKRQTNIWEQSAETFKFALASSLKDSMEHHAKSLVKAESELLAQTSKTAVQFNEALNNSATSILSLREETARQTETVREILGTKSQLIDLEERLHENLSALAQIGNFEETVNSLAAAIHLLNSNRRTELRAG